MRSLERSLVLPSPSHLFMLPVQGPRARGLLASLARATAEQTPFSLLPNSDLEAEDV